MKPTPSPNVPSGTGAAAVVRARQQGAVTTLLKRSHETIESEIVGDSMGSTAPPGTRIRIRCADQVECNVGSVVAFRIGRRLVAHRIVRRGVTKRARDYVLTKGDAAVRCDSPVRVQSVLGIVDARYDEDGWHPIPGSPNTPPMRRIVSGVLVAVVGLTMNVHVDLANFLVRALKPARRRSSDSHANP